MATFIVTTKPTAHEPIPSEYAAWEWTAETKEGNEVWIVTTDAPRELLSTIQGHPQVVSIYDASDDGR